MTFLPVKGKKPSRRIRIPSWVIVVGAFIVGIAYVAVYFYMLQFTNRCKPEADFIGPVVLSYLSCLEINSVGDALGGAFGPLAFIFLAAALIVQSMELAEQRKELDETQEVMREQLEASREQVRQTIESTRLFKEQTNFLALERQAREQADADSILRKTISVFQKEIANFDGITIDYWSYWHPEAHADEGIVINVGQVRRAPPGEDQDSSWMALLRKVPILPATANIPIDALLRSFIKDTSEYPSRVFELHDWDSARLKFQAFIALCDTILARANVASDEMKIEVASFQFLRARNGAEDYMNKMEEKARVDRQRRAGSNSPDTAS